MAHANFHAAKKLLHKTNLKNLKQRHHKRHELWETLFSCDLNNPNGSSLWSKTLTGIKALYSQLGFIKACKARAFTE